MESLFRKEIRFVEPFKKVSQCSLRDHFWHLQDAKLAVAKETFRE